MYQNMGYLKEVRTEFNNSKSKKEKEDLANNVEKIIKTLNDNVSWSEQEIQDLKNQKDQKMNQLNAILQQEKDYFTKVKQFEGACEEQERLQAQYKKQRKQSVRQAQPPQ